MKVTCAVPRKLASEHLVDDLKAIGASPIVTPIVVRAYYEGTDIKLGQAIVDLFEKEEDHSIVVIEPKPSKQRHAKRS